MKSALFVGDVRHRRFAPKVHQFRYSLLLFYIDLDEVDRIFRFPLICAQSGPSIIGFTRKNYLGDSSATIQESVRNLVREKLGREVSGPIRLLTQVSYFGFCFNPVSFYYCFDEADTQVEFIVAEITNTPWLERHAYVFEADKSHSSSRFEFPKAFHVSPFLPMTMDYRWSFSEPSSRISIHMENRDQGQEHLLFDATLTVKRKEFGIFRTPLALLAFPLLTIKSLIAIYFEALILKLKGVPIYNHPKPGETT